ncbi:hypothetical protein K437DRAFT_274517 [Tilletiaria anomala UBC 951]|uniref:FHA domain-containing protein n=1 Tax=Tilletiaria anomala (strain ATCC 24038 / CBS 436.72 / UBC 951) TaxID=1037660 RepID=A0A066VSV2_TILAU|nr:uncharacterized protein K437DRAFT_274517 [Tilletiaria anomala UBC 951]KDN44551.1 hypothetical protein K437DRAFT_274517 [Tilletiaria anomala UBC 951]
MRREGMPRIGRMHRKVESSLSCLPSDPPPHQAAVTRPSELTHRKAQSSSSSSKNSLANDWTSLDHTIAADIARSHQSIKPQQTSEWRAAYQLSTTPTTHTLPIIFDSLKRSVGLTPSVSFQRVPSASSTTGKAQGVGGSTNTDTATSGSTNTAGTGAGLRRTASGTFKAHLAAASAKLTASKSAPAIATLLASAMTGRQPADATGTDSLDQSCQNGLEHVAEEHTYGILVLEDKKGREKERFPMNRNVISMGRCVAMENDVRFLKSEISRVHCRIIFDDNTGEASIEVLGSNGIDLNGIHEAPSAFPGSNLIPLCEGDLLLIAKRFFRMRYPGGTFAPLPKQPVRADPIIDSPANAGPARKGRSSNVGAGTPARRRVRMSLVAAAEVYSPVPALPTKTGLFAATERLNGAEAEQSIRLISPSASSSKASTPRKSALASPAKRGTLNPGKRASFAANLEMGPTPCGIDVLGLVSPMRVLSAQELGAECYLKNPSLFDGADQGTHDEEDEDVVLLEEVEEESEGEADDDEASVEGGENIVADAEVDIDQQAEAEREAESDNQNMNPNVTEVLAQTPATPLSMPSISPRKSNRKVSLRTEALLRASSAAYRRMSVDPTNVPLPASAPGTPVALAVADQGQALVRDDSDDEEEVDRSLSLITSPSRPINEERQEQQQRDDASANVQATTPAKQRKPLGTSFMTPQPAKTTGFASRSRARMSLGDFRDSPRTAGGAAKGSRSLVTSFSFTCGAQQTLEKATEEEKTVLHQLLTDRLMLLEEEEEAALIEEENKDKQRGQPDAHIDVGEGSIVELTPESAPAPATSDNDAIVVEESKQPVVATSDPATEQLKKRGRISNAQKAKDVTVEVEEFAKPSDVVDGEHVAAPHCLAGETPIQKETTEREDINDMDAASDGRDVMLDPVSLPQEPLAEKPAASTAKRAPARTPRAKKSKATAQHDEQDTAASSTSHPETATEKLAPKKSLRGGRHVVKKTDEAEVPGEVAVDAATANTEGKKTARGRKAAKAAAIVDDDAPGEANEPEGAAGAAQGQGAVPGEQAEVPEAANAVPVQTEAKTRKTRKQPEADAQEAAPKTATRRGRKATKEVEAVAKAEPAAEEQPEQQQEEQVQEVEIAAETAAPKRGRGKAVTSKAKKNAAPLADNSENVVPSSDAAQADNEASSPMAPSKKAPRGAARKPAVRTAAKKAAATITEVVVGGDAKAAKARVTEDAPSSDAVDIENMPMRTRVTRSTRSRRA